MKILLDENLDWRLRRDLPGHTVEAVPLMGWAGTKNGKLLAEAAGRFDVLITMDSAMVVEQDVSRCGLAIIVLEAPSNRLADTRPLMPKVLAVLDRVTAGTVTRISR